ncbi:MAG TPA: DNA polymerase III subunit gamma/tau [Candidatus Latescibacteria bacterium]|nr:DNA polymerase III subunit gamma/tau [Candidatus Latescibacterota bacterium]
MSYIVLSRKWRPLVFEDIVAQEHVTKTLKNAISSGRIAHAYLFSGPRGVGKTTTARILAKALNCLEGPTPTPCNRCTPCREITAGSSLDVLEIDGASNRGIDEVRELRENVRYAPSQGRYKVYIIDEVHMLTTPAFNALLKTLEEPPKHVVFIFATTQPQSVPLTVLSRCQRFDFKRIPVPEITKRLATISKEEGIEVDDNSLRLIAKKADGAMRDAESLLDQVISFGEGRIYEDLVEEILGLVDREVFFELIEAIGSKDTAKGLDLVGRVLDGGGDIGEFTSGLLEHLRNLLIAKIPGGTGHIEAPEIDRERSLQQSAMFSEEDLLRMIKIVSDLELSIRRAPHPRLRLEIAVVSLIKLDSTILLSDLIDRLSRLEQGFISDAHTVANTHIDETPVEHLTAKETVPEEELTLETIRKAWDMVVKKVKVERIGLGSVLAASLPVDFKGGVLRIAFGKENGFGVRQVEKHRKLVEKILGEIFKVKIRIECVTDDLKKPQRKQATSLDDLYKKDPMLRKVVKIFNGDLIEIGSGGI